MRRLSGVILAGAMLLLPAFVGQGTIYAQAAPTKLTFEGDSVVWMFTVKPDKIADFEAVIAALKDALAKSPNAEAKQQAAGWKIVKAAKPQPDGTIVYAHIINPVVAGADYSVMNNIYAVIPPGAEQKALYDKYVGAFNSNLLQVPFSTVSDLGK